MKVVVVGAGGYVGRHLCAHLQAGGNEVVGLSSAGSGGIDARSGLLPADFSLPRDAGAVVFLAQSPWSARGTEGVEHVLRVNCVAAVAVAAAALEAGIARLVYASTGNVYAASFAPLAESAGLRLDNWYALSKVHAEQALALFRAQRLGVHAARLFGVYGPAQRDRLVPRLIEKVRRRQAITLAPRAPGEPAGAVTGLRLSPTYIDDIARILAQLAAAGGPEVINVAGDEALSVRDIALEIGRQIDLEPVFTLATAPREGDLVADNHLLHQTLAPHFTPFARGIALTLAGHAGGAVR